MDLVFLGSGGGRWVTLTQRMRTGGFRIHDNENIHVDPGPGALIAMHEERIDPLKTDAVFVTHCHPDHYNDAEILIEAMTGGATRKRGALAGSGSVLVGSDTLGPAISKYHQSKVLERCVLKLGQKVEVGDVTIEALPTKHSDPSTVGLKFYTDAGTITYSSDTEYFDGLLEEYRDSQILVLNTMRPASNRIPWHLCTDDAITILKEVRPKLAILNHFGMKMLGIRYKETKRVEEESGVKTLPADDGMRLNISDILEGVSREKGFRKL
ncbi:MAG: MBL fold metallo-hydrolase [Candidatus Hydrothermarchaeales archaeon]